MVGDGCSGLQLLCKYSTIASLFTYLSSVEQSSPFVITCFPETQPIMTCDPPLNVIPRRPGCIRFDTPVFVVGPLHQRCMHTHIGQMTPWTENGRRHRTSHSEHRGGYARIHRDATHSMLRCKKSLYRTSIPKGEHQALELFSKGCIP